MHESSYLLMKDFRDRYLDDRRDDNLCIYDFGSQDVNGTYRNLFSEKSWKYVGIDLVKGNNVDIILSEKYEWKEIHEKSCDVFISGQVFEHVEYFWASFLEVERIMKNDALCCIIVPSSGMEHKYPVDCYRFFRDGASALAKFAGLQALEISTSNETDRVYSDGSEQWRDTRLIAKKTRSSLNARILKGIYKRIQSAYLKSLVV